jgi:hypothetical protein
MASDSSLRTPDQVVAFARTESLRPSQDWDTWCLRFCARAYGLSHSGYNTAWEWWEAMPEDLCHYTRTAPHGAIMAFKGGHAGQGHAAISTGKGYCYTTGWKSDGRIYRVTARSIEKVWDMEGARWAYGHFPRGV